MAEYTLRQIAEMRGGSIVAARSVLRRRGYKKGGRHEDRTRYNPDTGESLYNLPDDLLLEFQLEGRRASGPILPASDDGSWAPAARVALLQSELEHVRAENARLTAENQRLWALVETLTSRNP